MSFLVRGNQGPRNITEGNAPRNIRGRGFFGPLEQAIMQAAGENNSGMGLSPTGRRRRSKFRMAGEVEGRRRSRLDDVRRGGRKGIKKGRPEGMPPRGPSKGTKHVTMRDPETGYKYGGKVVDGVPQFTKPDFSDRKPLPGYPKKETDRTSGRRGPGIRPPRDEVSIMPVPPNDEVSIMPIPPDQPSIMPVPPDDGASTMPVPPRRPLPPGIGDPDPRAINTKPRRPRRPIPRGYEGIIDKFPDPRTNVRPRPERGRRPRPERGRRPRRGIAPEMDRLRGRRPRRERKGNMQDTNHSFGIK